MGNMVTNIYYRAITIISSHQFYCCCRNDELVSDVTRCDKLALCDETTLAVANKNGITLLDTDTGIKKSLIASKLRLGHDGIFCFDNTMLFVFERNELIVYDNNGVVKFSSTLSNLMSYPYYNSGHGVVSIAVNPYNNTLYFTSSYSNVLHVIDTKQISHSIIASQERLDHPLGIAIDNSSQLHICCRARVEVINTQGHYITSYSAGFSRPVKIAIHPLGFIFVALENDTIAVFGSEYQHLYSIKILSRRILDMLITPNGILWISYVNHSVQRRMELVRLPFSVAFYPPPSLSLFCQSTILSHLADIPASLLPPKYLKHVNSWSKQIQVEVILPQYLKHVNSWSKQIQVEAMLPHSTAQLSFSMRIKPSMSHLDIMEYLLESKRIPSLPGYTKEISVMEAFDSISDKYIVTLVLYSDHVFY